MKSTTLMVLFCIVLLAGCSHSGQAHKPQVRAEAGVTVHVVRHGWHTGIVVPVSDIPEKLLPEKKDFPGARYLEIGWGDAGFYRAKDITLALSLNALLRPTESIVHIVGFKRPVAGYFQSSAVFKFDVGQAGFEKLVGFLHASVLREDEKAAQNTGPGRYGISKFYKGTGTYHMFRTCNNWTAEAMVEAGLSLSVISSATAEGVMGQLRQYAVVQREMPAQISGN